MDKLYGLIQDINPKEICNHIENGNLAEWCNAWRIAAKEALQPKTNADLIRAMNDEELATQLVQVFKEGIKVLTDMDMPEELLDKFWNSFLERLKQLAE